ncbi:hypothetical protein LTR09_012643 [Extremus antarcticus]|uniref:Uncharacterized protein n=1 Tax=Extremus antarcticus TaxID=702011 RepID=A0AAJ0D4V0_9PEZI|nr:hypothetical protein LTR09_012643 [Extremus antarcticus]
MDRISKSFQLPNILTSSNYDSLSKAKGNSLLPQNEPQERATTVDTSERRSVSRFDENASSSSGLLDSTHTAE